MLDSGHCRCGHERQRTKKNCPVGELPGEQGTRNSSQRAELESKEGLCQDKGITNHHGSVTALYLQFSSFPNSQMSCCEDPLLQSIEKDVVLSSGNLYHSGNILATGYFSMKSYVWPWREGVNITKWFWLWAGCKAGLDFELSLLGLCVLNMWRRVQMGIWWKYCSYDG